MIIQRFTSLTQVLVLVYYRTPNTGQVQNRESSLGKALAIVSQRIIKAKVPKLEFGGDKLDKLKHTMSQYRQGLTLQ